MNVMRYTVIDSRGGVSFIAPCEASSALAAACAQNPQTLEQFLDIGDVYYHSIKEYVLSGLAVFDEWNCEGGYGAIHAALRVVAAAQQPVFRVVDELTREASLRPVKAGAIIFNLVARRIIQMQNSYQEIRRRGRGRIFDGYATTDRVFSYALPGEWTLVP